jgi:hypothetical protein
MMVWLMQSSPSREDALSSTPSVSVNPPSFVRFPGEDGGHSLAEMARRDLDAALQLLADRAQYITGATGAAIALRRNGKNDMLCRASTGSNAPELGALLSTEFGLSGESVRTRQPLRCDDAESDVRVNREVCRQLGIASVVVMPVVNDDGVLGVFELFSGRVNAFGERDLSAVQRLSEMVETAVRLAEAAEKLPERLMEVGESVVSPVQPASAPQGLSAQPEAVPGQVVAPAAAQDQALNEQVLEEMVLEGVVPQEEEVILEEPVASHALAGEKSAEKTAAEVTPTRAAAKDATVTVAKVPLPSAAEFVATVEAVLTPHERKVAASAKSAGPVATSVRGASVAAPITGETVVPAPAAAPVISSPAPAPSKTDVAAKKASLFWSAAGSPSDAARPEEADQSHVPPMLRSLQQCQACGFPVSTGRSLCVECEEKKWRGQLKVPQKQAAGPAAMSGTPRAEGPMLTDKAASVVSGIPVPRQSAVTASANSAAGAGAMAGKDLHEGTVQGPMAGPGGSPVASSALQAAAQSASVPSPDAVQVSITSFVLSAGLVPSQSWLAANKYIIAVLLLVLMIVAGFFLLR